MMTDGTPLDDESQPPDLVQWWGAVANQYEITPFRAKALYVIGMMRHLAEGAIRCLRTLNEPKDSPYAHVSDPMELPAYVLVADAIEALGRCLLGCQCTTWRERENGNGCSQEYHGPSDRLKWGLEHLAGQDQGFQGSNGVSYPVGECIELRHFVTHGGTSPVAGQNLDRELTCILLDKLGDELTDYWDSLRTVKERQDNLAKALIRPLSAPGQSAVHVANMLSIIRRGGKAGDDIHRPPDPADNSTRVVSGSQVR